MHAGLMMSQSTSTSRVTFVHICIFNFRDMMTVLVNQVMVYVSIM
jgi:hypothetical protein